MHLNQRGCCSSVLLAYTTIVTLFSPLGHCDPTGTTYLPSDISESATQLNSHSTDAEFRNDRSVQGFLTTKINIHQASRNSQPRHRGGRPPKRRYHYELSQGGAARKSASFQSRGGPDRYHTRITVPRLNLQRFEPRMESLNDKSVNDHDARTESSSLSNNKECRQGTFQSLVRGHFYTSGYLDTSVPNHGYQSNLAISGKPVNFFVFLTGR